MSESLKTMLHQQATSVAFRPPDLEAIAHTGGRRIRRRRAATVVAAVSAVMVVVVGGVVALRNAPGGGPPVTLPAGPWPSDSVTWALRHHHLRCHRRGHRGGRGRARGTQPRAHRDRVRRSG